MLENIKLKVLPKTVTDDEEEIDYKDFDLTDIKAELVSVLPSADEALDLLLTMLEVVKQGNETEDILRYAWVYKPTEDYSNSIHLVSSKNVESSICNLEIHQLHTFTYYKANHLYLFPQEWSKSVQFSLTEYPILLCRSCKFIHFKLMEILMKSFKEVTNG